MATTRKRSTPSSGFSSKESKALLEESISIEEFLDHNATEMFETISRLEEELTEKKIDPVTEALPVSTFVPDEIIPTEDAGPRFVGTPSVAPVIPKVEAPVLKAPPKRHPRNVPRFTPYKK